MNPADPVTRLPEGITNVGDDSLFADLRMPDPTIYHSYLDDFDCYTAGEWLVTETDSNATQALVAGDGGLLLVTNTAGPADLVALQKTPAAWFMEVGKKAFFRTRFRVSDAVLSDVVMGLQVVDDTPLDVTDGVYFLKASGSATVDIVCRKNATTGSVSAADIATLANNTFIELGWYYDGVSKLVYEVNRVAIGSLTVTDYLPDAVLTVSFAIQNGEAVAKTLTADYIAVFKERT